MVSVVSLWLPVLVSAVLVFLASSLFHMVLKYHRSDAGPLPDEDKVAGALRPLRIPPGDYALPYGAGPGSRELLEKFKQGPVAIITVMPNGLPALGLNLARWFGYSLLVGAVAGYTAGITLGPGAEYALVFRVVGTVAFAGYSLANPAGEHLVVAELELHPQDDVRRPGLRAADGRRIRLALAVRRLTGITLPRAERVVPRKTGWRWAKLATLYRPLS